MMHRTTALTSGAAAILSAAAAHANFTGWSKELITLGNGHVIMNVYANFDNTGDRLVSVLHTSITTNTFGGFYQSAANPFWQPGSQNKTTADDSFVCIDVGSNGNASSGSTVAYPEFFNFTDLDGATDFSVITGTGTGAGWYNPNSQSSFGLADGGKVLAAHFVATGSGTALPTGAVYWQADCIMRHPNGFVDTIELPGVMTLEWQVPGPGGLAVLGGAWLAARRRRPR